MECLDLDLQLRDLEPFFGQLALFDVKKGCRISENFYFQLNHPSTKEMLKQNETSLQQAIFTVSHGIEDVFIVLRIEKVLEGKVPITTMSRKLVPSQMCPSLPPKKGILRLVLYCKTLTVVSSCACSECRGSVESV